MSSIEVHRQHYNVTFTLLALAAVAYALLQSLVAPALLTIQHDLHTTTAGAAWILSAYLLSASVVTPIAGRLGDMFGKKRMLVANSTGEVVGFSDLAGDASGHPFLGNGHRLIDLGTLGGDSGAANWVNDAGSVVGSADVPGSQTHHGFLWANGIMRDLPPSGDDPCANAFLINARGQAVGNDTDCADHGLNAMLWENGSALNLNALVDPTPLHLTEAFFVSARGEIGCLGTLPNGDTHVALLTPVSGASASKRVAGAAAAFTSTSDSRDRFETLPERIAQLSSPAFR